ncbi:MAG: flagellar biosynthetic protein FliR [Gammaproteobacteria bacterium]|nr:flagellar biosynthetic protein FliR [Gammaproteobacteria bacterium]
MWTMLRISGVILVAPVLGAVFIPARVRILLAIVLATAMLPVVGEVPQFSPLSAPGLFTIMQELIIGVSIGFILKLTVEAAIFAGQLVSVGMGLSFATVVDPQQGGTPLLGRFYIIITTLLLLAANGHLALIQIIAESYSLLAVGAGGLAAPEAKLIVDFASLMFVGAMQLSLPVVVAILMVNVAFGVISRAAPTLNLFAVGFPITMLTGFIMLTLSTRSQGVVWDAQFTAAFSAMSRLLGGG